jgi:hypothetical protein
VSPSAAQLMGSAEVCGEMLPRLRVARDLPQAEAPEVHAAQGQAGSQGARRRGAPPRIAAGQAPSVAHDTEDECGAMVSSQREASAPLSPTTDRA